MELHAVLKYYNLTDYQYMRTRKSRALKDLAIFMDRVPYNKKHWDRTLSGPGVSILILVKYQ